MPTITIPQILLGIQDLLTNPNLDDPAQRSAFDLAKNDRAKYEEKVRKLAAAYSAD